MIACQECRHIDPGGVVHICNHPRSFYEEPDYYKGITKTARNSAFFMRLREDLCGKDAKLFEPKEP